MHDEEDVGPHGRRPVGQLAGAEDPGPDRTVAERGPHDRVAAIGLGDRGLAARGHPIDPFPREVGRRRGGRGEEPPGIDPVAVRCGVRPDLVLPLGQEPDPVLEARDDRELGLPVPPGRRTAGTVWCGRASPIGGLDLQAAGKARRRHGIDRERLGHRGRETSAAIRRRRARTARWPRDPRDRRGMDARWRSVLPRVRGDLSRPRGVDRDRVARPRGSRGLPAIGEVDAAGNVCWKSLTSSITSRSGGADRAAG